MSPLWQPLQIASHLTALIAQATLLLAGTCLAPIGAAGIAATGGSLLLQWGGWPLRAHPRIWNTFAGGIAGFFLFDLLFLSRSLLVAATDTLVLLLIHRLFHLQGARDHLKLLLLAFFQVLSAAGEAVGLFYAFCFVLYLVVTVWGLLLYHLRQEYENQTEARTGPTARAEPAALSIPFFFTTNAAALGSFVLTLAIFFMIPRMGLGLLHQGGDRSIRTTGFSDQVAFGSVGPIKKDRTIVMRILPESDARPGGYPLYLRGAAFDLYTGSGWARSRTDRRPVPRTGNIFQVGDPRKGRTLEYTILLEPLDLPVLFAPVSPVAIRGPFPAIFADELGAIALSSAPAARLEYSGTSVFASPIASVGGRPAPSASPGLERYLQIPEGYDAVGALARRVAGSARGPYEQAQRIEQHLRNSYAYSLDVAPPPPGVPPILDFLFGQKKGYCEHYATSMVLMLRALGIPSRLVTGYLPGEWNEFGQYFTIRQSEAHAWVEAWLPEAGWILFDPTPPALEAPSWLVGRFERALDSLRLKWDRYVIQYSARDQEGLVREVVTASRQAREQWGRWIEEIRSWLPEMERWGLRIAGTAGAIAAALILYRAAARRVRKGPARRPAPPLPTTVSFYPQALRLLAHRGWVRPPAVTPREFSEHLAPDPLRRPLAELTDLYYRIRHGGETLSPDESHRVSVLLLDLKQGVARGVRPKY